MLVVAEWTVKIANSQINEQTNLIALSALLNTVPQRIKFYM